MLVLHNCIWKRIYWEKATYIFIFIFIFFVSDKTLFITTISKFVKVNSVHFKKKKSQFGTMSTEELGTIESKANWEKYFICLNWEESIKRTIYGLATTLDCYV